MPNEERPQDFELMGLLVRKAVESGQSGPSTSTQQKSDFESFKTRFQSYIDQIPSYLHSVGKEGFFPHFFLGSFSTFIDTKIAKDLNIEKIYFSFDGPKTLKVAIIKEGRIKSVDDAVEKVKLFVIVESDSTKKKFSYNDLDKILGNVEVAQNNWVRQARDGSMLDVKLVEITKKKDAKGKMAKISVEVKSDQLNQGISTACEFKEIKKGLWSNPESDIAKLTNSKVDEVKGSIEKILKKICEVHSKYRGEFKEERLIIRDGSLVYAKEAQEAAHHGFIAGALVNFRYRHNLRVYLEQFAGRGYADIILVPRGEGRSLNTIPIIIELKAATKEELKKLKKEGEIKVNSKTAPAAALEQAKNYTEGFQPNVMRVLTTANDILCVGVNLDYPSPISEIVSRSRNQEITPLFNDILESIDRHNNGNINEGELKQQIQGNIKRIYHIFPGTGEKGDPHYFSRFLLGQSLLLNEVEALNSNFEKYVFIYGENIPTKAPSEPKSQRLKDQKSKGQDAGQQSNLNQSHGIVTIVFIPKNGEKLVYVVNIIETDGRTEVLKKGFLFDDNLTQKVGNKKVVELNLNFNVKKQKAKFEEYFSMEISQATSLDQYNDKRPDKFQGNFEIVPYPDELKETFDKALESQLTSSQDQSLLTAKYNELFKKLSKAVWPFKSLIGKELHTQAVLDGAFSHYSDIKLGESQENRALVLTEFQTGMGKRIDMLIHSIKFTEGASSAKDYYPVLLELKGPRGGKSVKALKDEAEKQMASEYAKCVACKTLTDGTQVVFAIVIFDREAADKNALILVVKDSFKQKEVSHSSIGSRDSRQVQSLHFNRKQQEVFSQFVSHNFPNVSTELVKQGLYLPSFEKRRMSISGKCVAITYGLSQALFLQSDKSFLSNLKASSEIYERIAQGKQVSEREEREVFAFSALLNNFERQLDSVINSLPSNLIHTQNYKILDDLSHYMAEVKGDFAIHLVTSNHVVAIYRIGDNYTYFDSNAVFISGLKGADQLMKVTEKGIKSAGYKVEEKGLLVEHFDVGKANNLLSSEDKQILAKEIKTECQLLAEQDKELGFIKINGQELSRVQLYNFGTKIHIEGIVPLLVNAEMNLSSKKFQGHLDEKEVSMVAREYLDHFKNGKNVEEATKFIPFEGSKREIEEAEQARKPKGSLLELAKGTINFILAAVSLANIGRSESQLPGKTDNKPETYVNDPIIDNQMQKSPGH